MYFSDNPCSVRVDFFKVHSGKWVATERMDWLGYKGDIHKEFISSIKASFGSRYKGLVAICLDPFNENAHPVMYYND